MKKAPIHKALHVKLPAKLAHWLREEAARQRTTQRRLLIRFLQAATASTTSEQLQAEAPKAGTRDALVAAVGEHYFLELACSESGVTLKQAETWMRVAGFAARMETARTIYLQRLQLDLLELGKGEVTGKFGAIVRFLEAHEPNWGRVKAELVLRILQTEYRELVAILSDELGPNSRDIIDKAMKRYEDGRDLRLASFTE